jgi:hypothetical protein
MTTRYSFADQPPLLERNRTHYEMWQRDDFFVIAHECVTGPDVGALSVQFVPKQRKQHNMMSPPPQLDPTWQRELEVA